METKIGNTFTYKLRHNRTSTFELTILAVPAILYFILFSYIPMLGTIVAFKNFEYAKGILFSPWVGLRNFIFFFSSNDAFRVSINTIGYGMVFIFTGIVSAVIVALLLYELKKGMAIKFYQTTMILPYFLSWVIVSYITYILFNPVLGVANKVLDLFHINAIQWYTEPAYWPAILTLVNIWKGIGLNSVIYYAALMAVDESLYEAARIDGASRLKQTLYISIPALIPMMTIMSIIGLGNVFRGDFGLFYQIPRDVGALYPTTDIIDTYIYRGLRSGDFGISAAVGLFQGIVGLAMVCGSNYIAKKIDSDNAMF